MNPVTTLVVLANEREARFLVNRGVGKGLEQLRAVSAADFSDTDVHYSDFPGRSHSAPGGAAHGFERPTSERRQSREAFARHIGDEVSKLWSQGQFDRLARIAAPSMLGALRDTMDGPCVKNLLFDLDKDLLNIEVGDLPGHLDDQALF